MNNTFPIGQSNGAIYNSLAEIQSVLSHYIQTKNKLRALDEQLRILSEQFDKYPIQHHFYAIQNIWSQKSALMQEICNIVNNIISSLTEATKIILTAMISSIDVDNKLSILLSDNAIGPIYSLAEQNQYQLNIRELYCQSCLSQNIPSLLSSIEIKAQMMRLSLPNFDKLKRLIRYY